jgi:hypothetical protein
MDNENTPKEPIRVYFATEEERDAFNAAEAAYRGCDMKFTEFWYPHGKEDNSYYIEVDDWE